MAQSSCEYKSAAQFCRRVSRWYWAGNEHGQRTWFQLTRIGDEVFEITARTASWDQVLNMHNGNS